MSTGWMTFVEVTCPVCDQVVQVPKVLYSRLRVVGRDTDFYTRYEGCEPNYYAAAVCQSCSYAASEPSFNNLDPRDAREFRALVGHRTLGVDVAGERDRDRAILCIRLALHWTEKRKLGPRWGLLGALYLRLAWIHRFHGDVNLEQDALRRALVGYKKCYEEEDSLPGKMTFVHLKYLIGELLFRTGELKESLSWYQLAMQDSGLAKDLSLSRQARDRYQVVKDTLDEAKA